MCLECPTTLPVRTTRKALTLYSRMDLISTYRHYRRAITLTLTMNYGDLTYELILTLSFKVQYT